MAYRYMIKLNCCRHVNETSKRYQLGDNTQCKECDLYGIVIAIATLGDWIRK